MKSINQVINPAHEITEAALEKYCTGLGLTMTMKDTLSSLPDNTHWHFKKGKIKGRGSV
jgi:hypothetical protein